jgi:hypothetical protein
MPTTCGDGRANGSRERDRNLLLRGWGDFNLVHIGAVTPRATAPGTGLRYRSFDPCLGRSPAMRCFIVGLWLAGAALYAISGYTFGTSSFPASEPLSERDAVPSERVAASPQQGAPISEDQSPDLSNIAKAQTAEQRPLPDNLSSVEPALPTSEAAEPHYVWGKLVRGAPVHSSPSVSSPVLGYADAGAQAQLVERDSGWVKVLDPTTSREGWILEMNVSPTQSADRAASRNLTKEAALEGDQQLAAPAPAKSFKAKKPGKRYVERRRKRVGFFFRFRRR